MKNNKKLILLFAMLIAVLMLNACGSLSDEDSTWNRTREVEENGAAGTGDGTIGFEPGTFEATSEVRGFGGFMTVEVTIDGDGNIADIEVLEHGESPDWFDRAVPALTTEMISSGSADVDGVSGATYTSGAFIDAVRIALAQAGGGTQTEDAGTQGANFTSGTFEATSEVRGFGGFMTVEVTIDGDGNISGIEVTSHGESPDWFDRAVPALTTEIIGSGSADVDGVSGATYTSGAFIDAVRIALEQAE